MKVISESSDVKIEKEILINGTFSRKPTERATCNIRIEDINMSGLSIDGKSVDEVLSSDYLKPSIPEKVIMIGDADSKIDEYVERVVQTMFSNEKSLVRFTLAHPDKSNTEHFCIELKITLVSYETYKPIWEWSPKEKYDIALIYKEAGVRLYKSNRVVDAFWKFSKACKVLITIEPIEEDEIEETLRKDMENLRKILYNNMAECHLIRKNFEHAISLCNKVLKRDENNVKALYRRAVAYENLKDYERAHTDMTKFITLEPKNPVAKEKLIIYKNKIHEAQKKFDNMVKRMFPYTNEM